MPYRELSMLEVREVLRRYIGGDGLRAMDQQHSGIPTR